MRCQTLGFRNTKILLVANHFFLIGISAVIVQERLKKLRFSFIVLLLLEVTAQGYLYEDDVQ